MRHPRVSEGWAYACRTAVLALGALECCFPLRYLILDPKMNAVPEHFTWLGSKINNAIE